MKKAFLKLAVAIAAVAFISVSCTEDDITNPTITITGSAAVTIDLGDTYTDAGATANDDKDGDLTSQITTTGTVDVNKVGIYEIEYTVSDEAGNTTTETRTVTVRANRLQGNYSVSADISGTGTTPGTYAYSESIATSSYYNKIVIEDFNGYTGLDITATVTGNAITISQTNVPWVWYGTTATGSDISTTATSTFSIDNAGATPIAAITSMTFKIDYEDGTYDNVIATYTKQ